MLCGWRLGRGVALGLLASVVLTALFFCLNKGKKEGKKEKEKERDKEERKSPPKENIPKKKKNSNQNQTKPNHQLKYTKYAFTKGDKRGYPVYFLGDLVIQANMAKPALNPKEPHTDEPM